jgi:drug/metabolite transporter (DMT)-like permease
VTPAIKGVGALVLGAAAIGFAPIFVRLADVGPVAAGFHRLFWSLPVFAVLALRGGRPMMSIRRKQAAGLSGVFFAGDMIVWHLGIMLTTIANASLFTNMAPVFVALALWLIWGLRPTLRFSAALAVTLAGAALLVGGAGDWSGSRLAGDGLSLLSGAFYAGYILAVGHARRDVPTPVLMAAGAMVAAPLILAAALALGEPIWPQSLTGWAVVLGLALVSQCAGQGLIAWGLAHVAPAYGALILLLQPVVAALIAAILFNEIPGAQEMLGAAVILAGIYFARNANRS